MSDAERRELASLASRRSTAQALALRARIVLACAAGVQNQEVAAELGVCDQTVGTWRRTEAASRTSSCTSVARCTSSMIAASVSASR